MIVFKSYYLRQGSLEDNYISIISDVNEKVKVLKYHCIYWLHCKKSNIIFLFHIYTFFLFFSHIHTHVFKYILSHKNIHTLTLIHTLKSEL